MKLLLDTHIFLWLNDSPEKLTTTSRQACENEDNGLYLSMVSVWPDFTADWIEPYRNIKKFARYAPWPVWPAFDRTGYSRINDDSHSWQQFF